MELNKSVNLKVNGIHCGGCANKIKSSVEILDQAAIVNVNVDSGLVNVKFNSENLTSAKIREAVTNVGFEVESVEIE